MKLIERTRSSCVLEVGRIAVLFSYGEPVAFHFPTLGIYEVVDSPATTKATRNHKIAFRARDPAHLIPLNADDFSALLDSTVKHAF